MTYICVGKQTIIGSDNGLSPGRRQAIIWTNAGILLIGPLGTNFSEISIKIQTFSFTKMCLKVSSAKWRPFCLGLNVLRQDAVIEQNITNDNALRRNIYMDEISVSIVVTHLYFDFYWNNNHHPMITRQTSLKAQSISTHLCQSSHANVIMVPGIKPNVMCAMPVL